ncbi:MAG: endolytic transglycosylase MltG, partial [Gallionella sp.]
IAYHTMQQRLQEAWVGREVNLPLQTPYQALILASIVEKETGTASDRSMIAGVFVNRLRKKMLLQTDPAVIYGIGERFDGNLRRRDLLADSPYNTYRRRGLTPTPIALPGSAALHATLHPVQTDALYFVARGDGSSQFSSNLIAHNRAVNQYQK